MGGAVARLEAAVESTSSVCLPYASMGGAIARLEAAVESTSSVCLPYASMGTVGAAMAVAARMAMAAEKVSLNCMLMVVGIEGSSKEFVKLEWKVFLRNWSLVAVLLSGEKICLERWVLESFIWTTCEIFS